jgi:membrane protein
MWKWLYGPDLVRKADRLGTYAAALAYCFVLSLVPFLVVTFVVGMQVTAELDLNDRYAENYAKVVGDIIPAQNADQTRQIFEGVERSARGGLLTIGFILAVYTSYNLMEQIIRTLNFIFDDPRRPQGWSWLVVGKTLTLLALWMGLLLLISISTIEATILRHVLDRAISSSVSKSLVSVLQVLIVIGALFGTVFLTYRLVPARRFRRTVVVEGSLLAASGWIVSSLIFAYVIPELLKTSATYIALGSVVAIMLWAQACAWSIIVGACWMVRFSTGRK